ncbi:hypothetical protein QE380_000218 [Acinetobacter baylyi]|uniref:Uncharacterized protein n=1 Tax=Acinetobacter baylyi TaxID=202950 RepID=A0ABU0URX1_ACIBI|nr:hypothetical protein [Acinetobacter baylyi]MDQ1207295.1 hypothetical protein [Acinetobacter baylyi]MDR6105623.1 hypothetical protein [Acinetobacter baylyi]MDR6187656.1 hypothetical protein [Acinetobacter baylyi]
MSIFVKTDANPTTPLSTMPYIEKDAAIIRGVTLAMFDFSNPDCYSGTGNIVGGSTTFNDLTVNASQARAQNNSTHIFAPVETGMIKIQGGSGSNRFVSLPTTFKYSSLVKKSLNICYFRIPKTGYTASSISSLIGAGSGGGATQLQYVVWVQADASGNLTTLRFRVKGTGGANIDVDITGTNLAKITGTTAQQFGFAVSINTSTNIATLSVYIDGELINSSSGSMTEFVQYDSSGGSPVLQTIFMGLSVSYSSNQTNDIRVGRVSAHDLTNRSDLSFTDILTKDRNAASGYVY